MGVTTIVSEGAGVQRIAAWCRRYAYDITFVMR